MQQALLITRGLFVGSRRWFKKFRLFPSVVVQQYSVLLCIMPAFDFALTHRRHQAENAEPVESIRD